MEDGSTGDGIEEKGKSEAREPTARKLLVRRQHVVGARIERSQTISLSETPRRTKSKVPTHRDREPQRRTLPQHTCM